MIKNSLVKGLMCFLFIFFSANLIAQKKYIELPVNERDVFFLYSEFGLPNSSQLKVVVISSYIYRYKYNYGYDYPALVDGVKAPLTNAFSEKMNEIVQHEFNIQATNRYNQVGIKNNIKLEFAFSDGIVAKGSGPELYLTMSSATEFIKRIRERIIKEYQNKGYTILQTGFDEYFDDHLTEMNLEKIEKLSPLMIGIYRTGDIKSMASKYQEGSERSGSGGIVIEDKSDNRYKSDNTSSTKKKDNTDWAALAAVKRMEAEAYEAEGDRLYKMGSLFYGQALEKYQQAQKALPNDRVQQKINGINNMYALGESLNQGLEKLEDASASIRESLDDSGVPRFRGGMLLYSGLQSALNRFESKEGQIQPWQASLTYGFYRYLAVETGLYYAQSPNYEIHLTNQYESNTGETIQINNTHAGFHLSGGIAIPLKSFLLYAMYGWRLPLTNIEARVLTEGYEYPTLKDDMLAFKFQPNARFGINYKIPKTRLAMGVHYMMNKMGGEKIIESQEGGFSRIKNGNQEYWTGKTVSDVYKFNTWGISLFLLQKNE